MSRQNHLETNANDNRARLTAVTIRQSIAHFFGKNDEEVMIAKITDHTLRDIGVDPTVYNYL